MGSNAGRESCSAIQQIELDSLHDSSYSTTYYDVLALLSIRQRRTKLQWLHSTAGAKTNMWGRIFYQSFTHTPCWCPLSTEAEAPIQRTVAYRNGVRPSNRGFARLRMELLIEDDNPESQNLRIHITYSKYVSFLHLLVAIDNCISLCKFGFR